MLGGLQHGGGVDDLAAHLGGGAVRHGETGGEGVGAVDHAAIHAGFLHLGGDFLHVAAVADQAGIGQLFLVQLIEGQDLLRVLAHGHVGAAHGHQQRAVFQKPGQLVKALHALGVALGHHQDHLVLQQVQAAAFQDEIQAIGVDLGLRGDIQLVHLLLSRGDEQVAVRALLDLGLQGPGGVEVVDDVDLGVVRLVDRLQLGEGFGHGGCRKDDQIGLLRGLLRFDAAAGGESKDHAQGQQKRKGLAQSHFVCSFSRISGNVFIQTRLYVFIYTKFETRRGGLTRPCRSRSSGNGRPDS